MKYTLSIILFIGFSLNAFAQKKPLIEEKDKIIAQAKTELNAIMANPEHEFTKSIQKNGIHGEYIFDLTIEGKGKILSVFVVSSEAADVKQQNLVKDLVKSIVFNFKMPKDKSYKFQYTFNF